VQRANRSALALFGHLARTVADAGCTLGIAGCNAEIRAELAETAPEVADADFWPNVDLALEASEDRLLGALGASEGLEDEVRGPEAIDVLNALGPDELAAILPLLREVHYQDGEHIIHRGDPADRIYFLAAGRASASVPAAGPDAAPTRIGSLSAGVVFGESALFEGGERVADVVADGPVTCLELTVEDLHAVAEQHPAIQSKLLAGVGANLNRFLYRATEQIRALEA
jgi:glutaminase